MKNKNDFLVCAYPFLYEKSCLCDYEIETDSLASHLGFAKSFCKDENLTNDLQKLIELVYHSNGSVRGKCAITQNDIDYLKERFDFYKKIIEKRVTRFCLPQGGNLASALHIARSKGKSCVRKLFFVKNEGIDVNPILLDFLNLTTNYIFSLALYANLLDNIDEIEFVSKSY